MEKNIARRGESKQEEEGVRKKEAMGDVAEWAALENTKFPSLKPPPLTG